MSRTYKVPARHWAVVRDRINSDAKDEPTRALAAASFQSAIAALRIEATGSEDKGLTVVLADDGTVTASLGAPLPPPPPATPTPAEIAQAERRQAEYAASVEGRLARLEAKVGL